MAEDNSDFFWYMFDRWLNNQKQVKPTPLDPTQQAINVARLDLIKGNNPWGQWAMSVAQPFINQALTMKPDAKFMSPELSGQPFAGGAGGPFAGMQFPGGGGPGGQIPNPFDNQPSPNSPDPNYQTFGGRGGGEQRPKEPLNRDIPGDAGWAPGGDWMYGGGTSMGADSWLGQQFAMFDRMTPQEIAAGVNTSAIKNFFNINSADYKSGLAKFGKEIWHGALKIIADNPAKAVATGYAMGGPIGAAIGWAISWAAGKYGGKGGGGNTGGPNTAPKPGGTV